MNDGFKGSSAHVLYISYGGLDSMCNTGEFEGEGDEQWVWGERRPKSLNTGPKRSQGIP